jgi:ubiquinone biosynthesis protein
VKFFTRLFRLIQINFILARYGLDQVILSLHLFRPLRFLVYFNPWNWGVNRNLTRGERIRLALEALGPIFVKFGQALSTRRDFVPEDIADELARLQDRVPPFPSEIAKIIIEKTFSRTLTELFAEFDLAPLASASIAQVHAATLLDGRKVVVKILRPKVLKRIKRDIDLMYVLAGFAQRYWSVAKLLRPVEVVAEFEQTTLDELNLQREAANASQLRRNFYHSHLLYIPEVYWPYTTRNILVTERIYGIPISDIATLKQNNIDLKLLAERGVEIFFTQVFRDCFFHADMHPGNIFVSPRHPENPQYLGVDFGIMGSLSPRDQRYLAENLLAFFNRDYRRVAELHVESGWVASDTRIDEFEAAIRTVCEPVFELPLKDISFGRLLLNLFQTARRFNMQVQPQLVLLQKTLFNIEGLGRQLYPDLDLWNTAKPFLEHWMKQQLGPRAFLKKVKKYAPYWAERFPEMPDLIYELLQEKHDANRGKQKIILTSRKKSFAGFFAGIGSALIVWALMTNLNSHSNLQLFTHTMLNMSLGVAGLLLLLAGSLQR